MEHGLLDELRFWVHPFFFGRADGDGLLFREGTRAMFDVVEAKTYASGVALLSYRLKTPATGS
jgi:riboflavin biosynthesis pyrimidine reductase